MRESEQVSAEKTYHAIGRFIFEFSQLEYTIRYYLAEEIRLDDKYFSPVVESYDVGLLCTVAIQVFKKSRGEEKSTRIKKIIDKFRDLNDNRNRVAHGLWVPFKDGGTVHHVVRRNLESRPSANQAEALEQLADDVNKLRAELEDAITNPDLSFSRSHRGEVTRD